MKNRNAAAESQFVRNVDPQTIEATLDALERVAHPAAPPPSSRRPERLRPRPRVLCVDDDSDVLAALLGELRDEYDVTIAETAAEALGALAASEPYAVLVSDVHMPDVDGTSLLALARTISPETARIVLTGYSGGDRVRVAMSRGNVFRLLEKPCPHELLHCAIDDAVAEVREREARRARLTTRPFPPKPAPGAAAGGDLASSLPEPDRLPPPREDVSEETLLHVDAAQAPDVLVPGARVSPSIRLVRRLAEGGMGSVWLADHLSLQTRVAVKFISTRFESFPELVARFAAEASATARVRSPHVAQVLEFGLFDGRPFMAMELLDGEDMGQRLERAGRIPLGETARIVVHICKALEKAHALGIVHRDITPANIFLVPTAGRTFAKLLDFGLATGADGLEPMTSSGIVFGTPQYVSPEQAEGVCCVPQSDLWSLAVVVYECLSGKRPFEIESCMGSSVAVYESGFTPLTWVRPELPPALDVWLARAFRREPAERFASAAEFSDALGEVLVVRSRTRRAAASRSEPRISVANRRSTRRRSTAP